MLDLKYIKEKEKALIELSIPEKIVYGINWKRFDNDIQADNYCRSIIV